MRDTIGFQSTREAGWHALIAPGARLMYRGGRRWPSRGRDGVQLLKVDRHTCGRANGKVVKERGAVGSQASVYVREA